MVTVYRNGNQLFLGPWRKWQPSKTQPMDLEATMEKYIEELARDYCLKECRYDPYQLHRSATTLRGKQIPMVEWPQTVGNMTDCGQALYDAVNHRTLTLYPDAELRRQASFAVGKETPRGFRIVKEKVSHKIDAIVALAMGTHGALQQTQTEPGILGWMRQEHQKAGLTLPPGQRKCPIIGMVMDANSICEGPRKRFICDGCPARDRSSA